MKAIWSFWTKPIFNNSGVGLWSLHHYFYSWIISVKTISRFYEKNELYTDDLGKYLLVDILGLHFKKVHVIFDQIDNVNSNWWAIGKILTYSLQDEAFIHFDSDVYLWDGLPDKINNADIIAQSPEYFNKYDRNSYYKLEEFTDFIRKNGGWLPEIWNNYTSSRINFEAACCGIFGGNDLKLIKEYSHSALKIVLHKKNSLLWNKWQNLALGNVLVEQFLIVLFLESENLRREKKKSIEYLFSANPFSDDNNNTYTHLISHSKSVAKNQRDIEEFILINFPEYISKTHETVQFIDNKRH
jgi:hypothetical protein